MRSAFRYILFSFAAGLLCLAGGCFGNSLSNGDIPFDEPQGGNTATLVDEENGSSPGGAEFNIPAGTVVSSNSVMNGQISLGATELASGITMGYDGEVYGGASYTPADAVFSKPVTLSIPVSGIIGTAYLYKVNTSAAVSQSGFTLLDDDAAVVDGRVSFSSSSFGSFFVGMPAMEHDEGAGGSL